MHPRTLVLAHAYANERRKIQHGYTLFHGHKPLHPTIAKTFSTVVEWISSYQWVVGWKDVHWQGYVAFVFESFAPGIPQPGQLKNRKLLRDYMKSSPEWETPVGKTDSEMDKIYVKALAPELARSKFILKLMGIDNTVE
jgi:hypothetical protein